MWYNHPQREVRPVKKIVALLLAVCVILCACGKEPEKIDYGAAILGTWYAVEYESEYVEFLEDGTVEDTFGGKMTWGDYVVDNETGLIWCNFGDDVFALQIAERDGKLILLDNNGTLVREEDVAEARAKYREEKGK